MLRFDEKHIEFGRVRYMPMSLILLRSSVSSRTVLNIGQSNDFRGIDSLFSGLCRSAYMSYVAWMTRHSLCEQSVCKRQINKNPPFSFNKRKAGCKLVISQ